MKIVQLVCLVLLGLQGVDSDGVQLKFYVEEEQPAGTFVGSVHSNSGVTYRLLASDGVFSLDANGTLTTSVVLDRERLSTVIFTLTVTATRGQNFLFADFITVIVTDVNDNPPTFVTPNFTVFIYEDASVGTLYPIQKAFDPDSGRNGNLTYSLISSMNDSTFALVTGVRGGIQRSSVVQLKLIKMVDREVRDTYNMTVTAFDDGVPRLNSSIRVTVVVVDVNDNPPLFLQKSYNASVKESLPSGSNILTVIASDADIGLNGDIEYSIKGETNVLALFTIDSSNGLLSTLSTLDYESTTVYRFAIKANNVGDSRQERTVPVVIYIEDVNDNAPVVSIRYVSNSKTAVVLENQQAQELVAFVDVYDRDPTHIFSRHARPFFTSGNDLMHFEVSFWEKQLAVLTRQPLDRENISHYMLTISAVDLGKPSLSSSATFQVDVGDKNDNTPIFSRKEYGANISESSAIDSSVATVLAVDDDVGSNGHVTYTLLSLDHTTAKGWFSVSNVSGVIQVATSLDREQVEQVALTIMASDNGQPRRTATARVHVVVTDANDNAPTFAQSNYTVEIPESLTSASPVIQVSASDKDMSTNGHVTYTLLGNVNEFRVDPQTGLVTTQQLLDRETTAKYLLTILGKDGGHPGQTGSASLTITLLDENDNRPVFTQAVYVANVRENNALGIVANVTAHDDDDGDYGTVSYRLLNNSTNVSLFSIDSHNGHIYTQTSFDREEQSYYRLFALATDGGNVTSRMAAMVEIFIINEYDTPPQFSRVSYSFYVVDTDPIGTVVGTVSASSRDSGQQARLVYSIRSDQSGLFNVTDTGDIKLYGNLDRQMKSEYNIVVEARDVGVRELVAAAPVHITVTDENQSGPTFRAASPATVTVTENATLGTVVYIASATDPDSGTSGRIGYRLVSETFSINASSGEVTVDGRLDRECTDAFSLVILAIDNGYPPRTARLNLTVTVADVNDNKPTFAWPSYAVTVSESVIPPHPFLQLFATDKDVGTNGVVSLYLPASDVNTQFELLADGNLIVKQSLDRERRAIYNLSVLARDNGSPVLTSTTNVVVYVGDINDNSPTFSNATFDFELRENAAVGTVVGVLAATDADTGRNALLSYSLQSQTGKNTLTVNNKTGDLMVEYPIDYESIVATLGTNLLDFVVVVQDDGSPKRSATVSATVTILDVNDNAPRFVQSVSTARVKENLPDGILVAKFRAIDADSGINSELSYGLTAERRHVSDFVINETTGELYTNASLDREVQDRYNVTVLAFDHGPVQLTSTVELLIHVTDTNDWSPVLDRLTLVRPLLENTSVDTVVARVQFVDKDSGLNGLLQYEITDGNDDQVFVMEDATGTIRTGKRLDFESRPVYYLEVTVYDSGDPRRSGSSTVIIEVLDINDNPPIFVSSSGVYHVPESASIGTTVTCVTARDADSSSNGVVVYAVAAQLLAGPFEINSSSGCIATTAYLDRETRERYVLDIRATDRANPASQRRSSITSLQISISDVNDNYPLVTSPLTLSVFENTTVGTVVARVAAVDDDVGDNSSLVFTSAGDESFVIDQNNGDLTLARQLDFDFARTHVVSVIVSDRGAPARSSLTNITLDVLDSNNHAPVLADTVSTFRVSELSPIGALITTFTSSDDDTVATEVAYNLENDYEVFFLDPRIGALFLTSPLDYNRQPLFQLRVVVSDGGHPVLSSTSAVSVSVVDENTRTPSFNETLYYSSVSENAPVGSVVTRLQAEDGDPAGPNSNLTYSIVNGDRSAFDIESSSGKLSVRRNLDREENARFVLVIRVEDDGRPKRFNTTQLSVVVDDVNDNAPIVRPSVVNVSVYEDVKRLSPLTEVTAVDLDSGANGRVVYSLDASGNTMFSINSSSGRVTLESTLDYELQQSYLIKVVASDGGSPSLSSTAIISVNVLDVNDHSPSFSSPIYSLKVRENSPIGASIFQVSAGDEDSGLLGVVWYVLVDDSHTGHFVMDSSGRLSVAGNVDRESKSRYQMTVLAIDSDPSRPRNGSTQLLVDITDANDHRPDFSSTPYRINSPTSVRSGTKIVTVKAEDDDTGSNAAISYRIIRGEKTFAVNAQTGELSTTTIIRGGLQVIIVEATDRGSPSLTGTAVVLLNVGNSVSVVPQFVNRVSTSYSVDQHANVGTHIASVSAKPAYAGHELEYSIVSGNNASKFGVDMRSGSLSVSQSLLHDDGALFKLTIMVRDINSSIPSLAFVTVDIVVRSVDNHAPKFTQTLFQGVLSEWSRRATAALILSASDSDTGKGGVFSYAVDPSSSVKGIFAVGATSGHVYTLVGLDRETRRDYNFSVLAIDEGSPRQTSSAMVRVIVSDENDSPPVFVPATIQAVRIPEDSHPGTSVARLSATDDDDAQNALVTFRLTKPSASFAIDPTSGVVFLRGALDRERQDAHTLSVGATDGLHLTGATLLVTVLDINDNAPVFSTDNLIAESPEQSGVGVSILHVSAQDHDLGPSGNVSYALGNPQALLDVEGKSGQLATTSNLVYIVGATKKDYNSIELTIVAADEGRPQLSSQTNIVLQVTDINDHGPAFLSPKYNASVREDALPRTVVTQVNARDTGDSPPLAQVGYSITAGNELGVFWIHPHAGILTTKTTIDYETRREYRLEIMAYDTGNRSLHSHTELSISVEDVNDNSPQFSAHCYNTTATTLSYPGSFLLTVSATDADSGRFGSVRYRIAKGDPLGLLAVDHDSGEIRLKNDVTFVKWKEQYNVTIAAVDGGNPPRSGTALLVLTIINVTAVRCGTRPSQATVADGSPSGTKISKVIADDEVTFTLVGVTVPGVFTLNQTSGVLSLATTADYERATHYDLHILLTSRHRVPPRHAACIVSVDVIGVNEFRPQFDSDVHDVEVSETTHPGDSVATVSATDKDGGSDGMLTYRVTSGNGSSVFGINNESATIYLQQPLDGKAGQVYVIHLQAVDRGFPSLNASTLIYVHVQQGNKPPVFQNATIRVVIDEDVLPGTVVARITAEDSNDPSSPAGRLRYRLADGNVKAFAIDPQTGVVTTHIELDREKKEWYNVTIRATDSGVPPLSADSFLIVRLRDVNDNSPSFHFTPSVVRVRENTPIGTVILRLNVSDQDVASGGGPFTFSLLNHSALFSVDSSTGIVETIGLLDREERRSYFLTFEARDSGKPQLTSSIVVEVVIDENDSPSHIEPFRIWLRLHSLSFVKLRLAQLTVSNITCELVNASGPFFVVDAPGCVLSALPTIRDSVYSVTVSSNDSRHSTVAHGVIDYVHFNRSAVSSAVSLSITNTTAADFFYYFRDLDGVFPHFANGVRIVSIRVSNTSKQLGVLVGVVGSDATSVPSDYLRNALSSNLSALSLAGRVSLEISDVCRSGPCMNGGTCSQQVSLATTVESVSNGTNTFLYQPYDDTYVCTCTRSFTGRHCELSGLECESDPCLNSGICVDEAGGGYSCQCSEHFTGRHCETAIDMCVRSDCAGNSTCVGTTTAFYCECPPGRTGDRCDLDVPSCSSDTCRHGGTCVERTGDYGCHCLPGYSGVDCQVVPYTFGFGSRARFEVVSNKGRETVTLEFEFATSVTGTVLLTVEDSTGEFLVITAGKTVQAHTNDGAKISITTDVTNGHWHQLQLHLNHSVSIITFSISQHMYHYPRRGSTRIQ